MSILTIHSPSKEYIPYTAYPTKYTEKEWVFFVWLSHKLAKDGTVLDAFCNSTASWKIITWISSQYREQFIYKTNLVQWVPLDKNKKIRYPNKNEKEEWMKFLLDKINTLKPKLVFLFWKQVSDFVINHLKTTKINEHEYQYWSTVFILVDHPSYIAVYKKKDLEKYTSFISNKINTLF